MKDAKNEAQEVHNNSGHAIEPHLTSGLSPPDLEDGLTYELTADFVRTIEFHCCDRKLIFRYRAGERFRADVGANGETLWFRLAPLVPRGREAIWGNDPCTPAFLALLRRPKPAVETVLGDFGGVHPAQVLERAVATGVISLDALKRLCSAIRADEERVANEHDAQEESSWPSPGDPDPETNQNQERR